GGLWRRRRWWRRQVWRRRRLSTWWWGLRWPWGWPFCYVRADDDGREVDRGPANPHSRRGRRRAEDGGRPASGGQRRHTVGDVAPRDARGGQARVGHHRDAGAGAPHGAPYAQAGRGGAAW